MGGRGREREGGREGGREREIQQAVNTVICGEFCYT